MMSGMATPIVSIIVPVFNVEKYLEKCLSSIAKQTLNNIEVIIINDGSTDNSLEICKNYSSKYNNFYLFTKLNEGQGVARNYGLSKASGEYIIFVDSDDWIGENLCKEAVVKMRSSNADFGNFGLDFHDESGNIVKKFSYRQKAPFYNKEIFHNALLDRGILTTSCNKIYKRSLLNNNNLLFPPLRSNEDVYFSRAVSQAAKSCIFIDNTYYHALVRRGSTSRKMSVSIYFDTLRLIDYEESHYDLADPYAKELFSAHIVKLWTYLLIQGSFRIHSEVEFGQCLDVANLGYFTKYSASKNIIKHLSAKNRFLMLLCRYPRILRSLARILAKFGIFPY
jgi:glycosyltransferase involved in cell wall biosynthesis